MEILHFKRNEESDFHIHAGSYSTCFYIPSKNVILYTEQNGTFGGMTYSVSTHQSLINEAQALWNNDTPTSMASFSQIKRIEYDDKTILNLIRNAKTTTSLEAKVKKGIQELLDIANPKPEPIELIESIDPTTIDETAKQHLEEILQQVTYKPRARHITTILRPEKKDQFQQEEYQQRIKDDFERFTQGELGLSDLAEYMRNAHEEGLVDIAQQYAKIILQEQKIRGYPKTILRWTYRPKEYYRESSLTEKLEAALYLNKPQPYLKKIHAQLFYKSLITTEGYNLDTWTSTIIPQHSHWLSTKEITSAATKAYETLMWPWRRYDHPNYLQAARVAKIYLNEKEFIEAGKRAVENFHVVLSGDHESIMGKEIFDLNLPDNLVRPLMGKIFSSLLWYNREHAEKNRAYYKLSEEEIKPHVNELHDQLLKNGHFTKVLDLRQNYPTLIETKTPSDEDLRTLIGLEQYQSQQRR